MPQPPPDGDDRLRAVEFYCGVGSLRWALRRACPSALVVASYDVSPLAAAVYGASFGQRPSRRDIRALSPAELDAHGADLWLLSPPCQPYTRNGLRLGAADGRACSLASLTASLAAMRRPPAFLLLENVVGFETSPAHAALRAALPGHASATVVLSPHHLGVPYSRPRAWLLLSAHPLPPAPAVGEGGGAAAVGTLASLLDAAPDWAALAVPYAAVRSALRCVDVAWPEEGGAEGGGEGACGAAGCGPQRRLPRLLNCVTKSYGRYARGTGSLVARSGAECAALFACVDAAAAALTATRAQAAAAQEGAAAAADDDDADADAGGPDAAASLRDWPPGCPPLRYLSPGEVARLHGLPPSFEAACAAAGLTRLQRYALLGNGLSVDCAAHLLGWLLPPGRRGCGGCGE